MIRLLAPIGLLPAQKGCKVTGNAKNGGKVKGQRLTKGIERQGRGQRSTREPESSEEEHKRTWEQNGKLQTQKKAFSNSLPMGKKCEKAKSNTARGSPGAQARVGRAQVGQGKPTESSAG